MFDVCTTGDTVHIDKIFKLLPHMRLIDVYSVTRGAHIEDL